MPSADIDPIHLEIERVFLLRDVPEIPHGARKLRIEQGYLPRGEGNSAGGGPALQGRLRRTIHSDGSAVYHHTIKRGMGLVREEIEREIPREEFERHWLRTDPVRIAKTRYAVAQGELVWEVDVFDLPRGLVLAEVELESTDAKVIIPEWIGRVLVREVTEDSWYTSRAIALRLAGISHEEW